MIFLPQTGHKRSELGGHNLSGHLESKSIALLCLLLAETRLKEAPMVIH